MTAFCIGGAGRERVEVEVLGYERATVGDYHDDNWLQTRVSVSAGAFSGTYDAAFLTDELLRFRDELQVLYRSLRGEAQFSSLEEQLSLRLSGNGRGEVLLKGLAVDVAGTGNRLEFELLLDQTHLLLALEGLNEILSRFPVRDQSGT